MVLPKCHLCYAHVCTFRGYMHSFCCCGTYICDFCVQFHKGEYCEHGLILPWLSLSGDGAVSFWIAQRVMRLQMCRSQTQSCLLKQEYLSVQKDLNQRILLLSQQVLSLS